MGTTRGEIDYVASTRQLTRPDCSTGWHKGGALVVLILCTPGILGFPSDANAQCTARDVSQTRLARKEAPTLKPQSLIRSAVDVPVWKTISVGAFSDLFALRRALDAGGCGVGDTASEILARPAFPVTTVRRYVELFSVSAAELGFQTETVPLGQIYARAQLVGFELATAEIGPQLRLQYLDQPIGEFRIVGMEPVKTWSGEPIILTVANGGAGLILIGQDGHFDAEIYAGTRFLFVRPNKVAPEGPEIIHY